MLPALLPTVPAQGPELEDRGPIVIDGDDAFCPAGDGAASGVVNCATADGSAARPYVIAGWRIAVGETGNVCTPDNPSGCPEVPVCDGVEHLGAVTICGTTRHVVVRGVEVRTDDAYARPAGDGEGTARPLVGFLLHGASNITLSSLTVTASGVAVRVVGPSADVRIEGAEVRAVEVQEDAVDAATTTVEDATSFALPPGLPLVDVVQADLVVADATIDGTLASVSTPDTETPTRRAFGIRATGAENGPRARLVLTDSVLADNVVGLLARDANVTLTGNEIRGNGQSGVVTEAGVETVRPAVALPSTAAVVEDNTIEVNGYGILQWGASSAVVQANRFTTGSTGVDHRAVVMEVPGCDALVRYNDLPDLAVDNRVRTCVLDARHNWWGSPDGPSEGQAKGEVDAGGALTVPIDQLPEVAVTAPPERSVVRGKATLEGTAAPGGDGPAVARVEATLDRASWSPPVRAEGTASWSLVVDFDDRLGIVPVWVRACSETDCGIPVRRDLEVVEAAEMPFAVLEVAPRVVLPGQTVTLDGAASFAPDDAPLVAWRFDLGDGRRTGWLNASSTEATYDRPGAYTVSLEVRDADDRTSSNFPEVTVRVVPGDAADEAGATVPHPAALAVLGALAAAAWLVKARRARRTRRSDRSHGRRRDRREERP